MSSDMLLTALCIFVMSLGCIAEFCCLNVAVYLSRLCLCVEPFHAWPTGGAVEPRRCHGDGSQHRASSNGYKCPDWTKVSAAAAAERGAVNTDRDPACRRRKRPLGDEGTRGSSVKPVQLAVLEAVSTYGTANRVTVKLGS